MKYNYFCFIYCDENTSISYDYSGDENGMPKPTREEVLNKLEVQRIHRVNEQFHLREIVKHLKKAYRDRPDHSIPYLREINGDISFLEKELNNINKLLDAPKLYFRCEMERFTLKNEVI